jgi:hypothetical protein
MDQSTMGWLCQAGPTLGVIATIIYNLIKILTFFTR